MLRALELLVSGEPVQLVAAQVGYRGSSSFIAAFRRELGETPGAFQRQADG